MANISPYEVAINDRLAEITGEKQKHSNALEALDKEESSLRRIVGRVTSKKRPRARKAGSKVDTVANQLDAGSTKGGQ